MQTFAEHTGLLLFGLEDLMCSESLCLEMQLYPPIKLYALILPARSRLLVNNGRLSVAEQIDAFVSSKLTNRLDRLRTGIRRENRLRMA